MTTSITVESHRMLRRVVDAVPILREVAADLDEAEAEALAGNATPPTRSSPQPVDDSGEPPTGHVDPTGDLAITAAVSRVRRRRTRITDALHDIDRALDHLERLCAAEVAAFASVAPAEPVTPSQMCRGFLRMSDGSERQCNRLREPGDERCAECKLTRDAAIRAAAPDCVVVDCDQRAESYPTKMGPAWREMCARHRKMAERSAAPIMEGA